MQIYSKYPTKDRSYKIGVRKLKTQRGIDTHNNIVAAAAKLFSIKKAYNVTVSEIVKEAGIAKGTFYIYFETKDDLVWHFLEHEFENLYNWFYAIEKFNHTKEEISFMIDYIVDYMTSNTNMLETLHNSDFFDYFGAKKIKRRIENDLCKHVGKWAQSGIEKNALNVVDPDFFAYFIVLGIHEILDIWVYRLSVYNIEEIRNKIKEVLYTFLK